jgi:hypothetical protein
MFIVIYDVAMQKVKELSMIEYDSMSWVCIRIQTMACQYGETSTGRAGMSNPVAVLVFVPARDVPCDGDAGGMTLVDIGLVDVYVYLLQWRWEVEEVDRSRRWNRKLRFEFEMRRFWKDFEN